MKDAGLEMGERKCATVHIVPGKRLMGENLQLESKIIRALKDGDCYKYLGIAENDMQLADYKVWEECSIKTSTFVI